MEEESSRSDDRQTQDGPLLSLLDKEDPKTTDLDLIIEERLLERSETTIRTTAADVAATNLRNAEKPGSPSERSTATETDLDNEDAVTVKYLPIEMGRASSIAMGESETKTKKVSFPP